MSIIALITFLLIGSIDCQAQRAKKHRDGVLSADSIRAKNEADSLALLNNDDIAKRRIDIEAPIDTARLAAMNDSINGPAMQQPKQQKKKWLPEPNKSVWLALAIPGAGQIYNRKYWKLPIVYGGFVGCAYALTWNGKMYKDYMQAFQDIMSDNPNNDSYMDFLPPSYTKEMVEARKSYYQDLFKKRKDVYRRQRDLSVIAFIGVYLLSVIDAYVDADKQLKLTQSKLDEELKREPELRSKYEELKEKDNRADIKHEEFVRYCTQETDKAKKDLDNRKTLSDKTKEISDINKHTDDSIEQLNHIKNSKKSLVKKQEEGKKELATL